MAQAHLKRIFKYADVPKEVRRTHFALLKDYNAAAKEVLRLDNAGYKTAADRQKIKTAESSATEKKAKVDASFSGIVKDYAHNMEVAVAKAVKFYRNAANTAYGIGFTLFGVLGAQFYNAISNLSSSHLFSTPIPEQVMFFATLGGAIVSGVAGYLTARMFKKRKEKVEIAAVDLQYTEKKIHVDGQ